MDYFTTFRHNLKTWLTRHKWTQEKLAQKTGIHKSHISALLGNKRQFNESHITSILNAIRVSPLLLFKSYRRQSPPGLETPIVDEYTFQKETILYLFENIPEYRTAMLHAHNLTIKQFKEEILEHERAKADEAFKEGMSGYFPIPIDPLGQPASETKDSE